MTKITPNYSNATKLLKKRQKNHLETNPRLKRVFKNIVRAKTNSTALEREELANISAEAAKIAIGEKPRTLPSQAARMFFTRKPTKTFAGFLPKYEIVETPQGTKFKIAPALGEKLYDIEAKEKGLRIAVFPEFKLNPQEAAALEPKWSDFNKHIVGSLGYLGVFLARTTSSPMPALIVWVTQKRGIPLLPRETQRKVKDWDIEAIKFLEKYAKQAGIRRIFVTTRQHHTKRDPMQYKLTRTKLQNRGYREGKLTVLDRSTRLDMEFRSEFPIYLVKKL